ncbi:MAG: 2-oxoglutarate and iron-dependent oxygenase domain-containing protein [Chitinophagales bacterium]|nr:2-oxoglutarate and iron-dependent oxygenase domain-containing protein [Chitinophagales bacterium]
MAAPAVPTVDLSKFLSGEANDKQAFVNELGEAFHTIGFVAVTNHGIPEQLIADFYTAVKAFFDLPETVKRQYEVEGLGGQRGYTSFGKEHAKHSNVGDLKEFWQIGQEVTDGDPVKLSYPDNVAVAELPALMEVGNRLYKSFENTGKDLLRAIALYLGLEENYFDGHVHNGNSILRAIHYPPITADPLTAIRSEQHEDINLITLLVGASADGLQLLTKNNEWLPVVAGKGQIIVNVGDMLQRLTNNVLRSTTHRVVNPPRELWHQPRLSIPFFLHPRSEMSLKVLDSCVTAENEKHYEDITAGAYLHERLVEIGLIKA